MTELPCNDVGDPFWFNSTDAIDDVDKPNWWSSYSECPLMNMDTQTNQVS